MIPLFIGLGIAAVVTAIAASSDNGEKERDAEREAQRKIKRLEEEAKEKRQQALKEQAEREARQRREQAEIFALQGAERLVQKFKLPITAGEIKHAVMLKGNKAEKLLTLSFRSSQPYKDLEAKVTASNTQQKKIDAYISGLESV